MTVYVDDMRMKAQVGQGRPARWSHLMADTVEELHAFAAEIGLKREWAQHEDDPVMFHYDVTDTKRRAAIAHGAVEITWREAGRMTMARRRAMSKKTKVKKYKPGVLVTGFDPRINAWMDNACQGHVLLLTNKAQKESEGVWFQSTFCMVCFKTREKVLVRWLQQKAGEIEIKLALKELYIEQTATEESITALEAHLRNMQS